VLAVHPHASAVIGGGLGDRPRDPRVDAEACEHGDGPLGVGGCGEGDHADAAVQRLLEILARHASGLRDEAEDGRQRPGRAVDGGGQLDGQHPLEVGCQAAAGDVRHGVGLGLLGQLEAGLGVDAGRLQELLTQGAAEVVDVLVQAPVAPTL
jgi:hypothetical protein